ncbi:MFS transporter [Chryseobacterium sp. CT-SW4]|uniref:hypothetical protein n=1 Tax=Chryseobacterium sp. SW-1 TaxID=3157343 RepID=UPI003B0199AB
MHHPTGPFTIPAINNYVPEKIKPWIFIFFLVIIQFSGGGVYLAALNETVGDRALMLEDVLMAGFSSMAGMALVFTIMLRLKMRFISKYALLICCSALILCNIICLTTDNLFILIAACFVAGMFRMWATFECNSTIQLWITPTRDMPVFFSYVYLLVNGVISLGTAGGMYVSLLTNWQFVNWIVIGALLFMMLLVMLLFNDKRFMPKFPLFGIDWLGALMWGMILLTVNFICIYGEHYDWWYSEEIRTASILLIVLLGLNLYRASFIRHPFIALATFRYKVVFHSLILYTVIDFFIAPSHILEHIYFEELLQYDAEHMIWLNVVSWFGVAAGACFVYRFFAVKKHSFKTTFMIGFSAILSYEVIMYFLIDMNTVKELFIVPLFVRNFGYVVIAVVLLSDLMKVPFHHFFQALSVQSFMSAACGGSIGMAVLRCILNIISAKNFQQITATMDSVNTRLHGISHRELEHRIEAQTLLVSFKEIYGYLVIGGIIMGILLMIYKYSYFPRNLVWPTMKTINKMLKKEIS